MREPCVKVTAVLAIRNEEAYLANCLRHLVRNGIDFAIIDNGSTDASPAIYRRAEFSPYLRDVVQIPFGGTFSLREQLRAKAALIERIETDWVIHLDADEIMHSDRDGEDLSAALQRVSAGGANVVNFDEFVFLPVDRSYVPDATGGQPLEYYYFFSPRSPRLMRAWRKDAAFSMIEHGGHILEGEGIRIAPESLALRHYLFRDQEHALAKYARRSYAPDELAQGWHGARAGKLPDAFLFPPRELLKRIVPAASRQLDRTEPWHRHYWLREANRT